jgi:hypothetical protein
MWRLEEVDRQPAQANDKCDGDCSEASTDLLGNDDDSRAQVCLPYSSPLPMSSPSPIPLTTSIAKAQRKGA